MKKHLFSLLLFLLGWSLVDGQWSMVLAQSTSQAYWTYIDTYKDWAIEQMQQYRIPASITLAQGLLESNAGRSRLATKANNHFGIKVGGSWTGPYVVQSDDRPNDRFRKYKSARESYIDHSKFLQQRRYQSLYNLRPTDYKGWARGLKAAGYATNPNYADALIRVIEMYSLHQFDTGKYRSQTKSTAATKQTESDFFQQHIVYKNNKNYFIVVEVGDDMATISQKTCVSLRKLYSYNDLPRDYSPTAGDIIYLRKKRKCASREFRKNPIHIVEVNQSLFDIAQLYGIRLESLCKLNGWDEPHAVQVGEILRIR
ncbi:MAG: glucosaminidase domain-containing protein [Bacteroidaceae bacterium]|nr:glucosaminidase domain-containing protein [Bacteroidaceae bacterium]